MIKLLIICVLLFCGFMFASSQQKEGLSLTDEATVKSQTDMLTKMLNLNDDQKAKVAVQYGELASTLSSLPKDVETAVRNAIWMKANDQIAVKISALLNNSHKEDFERLQQIIKGGLVKYGNNQGGIAPDLIKPDINGEPVSLSQFRGKYVLLDFWGKCCDPSRAANPHLKGLYNTYSSWVGNAGKLLEDKLKTVFLN